MELQLLQYLQQEKEFTNNEIDFIEIIIHNIPNIDIHSIWNNVKSIDDKEEIISYFKNIRQQHIEYLSKLDNKVNHFTFSISTKILLSLFGISYLIWVVK